VCDIVGREKGRGRDREGGSEKKGEKKERGNKRARGRDGGWYFKLYVFITVT
jgi:hypothetical protein